MTPHSALELFAVPGLPMVQFGDDLVALIADALAHAGRDLRDSDGPCRLRFRPERGAEWR